MKDSLVKYAQPVIISLGAVFDPIKGTIIAANVVIIVDLITGVIAAKKRGEAIRSSALRRSLSKFLIYNTAILIGFIVEKFLINDSFPITQIVAGIVGTTESLSIYENLNSISDNKIFSVLVKKLGSANDALKKEDSVEPPK